MTPSSIQAYRFSSEPPRNGGESGTLSDPYVVLWEVDGDFVADDDDGSGTLDSLLVYTAEVSGDYFIDAGHLGGGTGTYELGVELV